MYNINEYYRMKNYERAYKSIVDLISQGKETIVREQRNQNFLSHSEQYCQSLDSTFSYRNSAYYIWAEYSRSILEIVVKDIEFDIYINYFELQTRLIRSDISDIDKIEITIEYLQNALQIIRNRLNKF